MQRYRSFRAGKGQSLFAGACGLILMVLFFGVVVALGVNSFVYGSTRAKLQLAANEGAGKVNRNIYWNGAQRPLFQRSKTTKITKDVEDYTKAICGELGLDANQITVTVDSLGDNGYSQVTVALSHLNLPYALAGALPGIASVSAIGISTEGTEPPPAFLRLGYNLIKGDTINPENTTDVTQVCILPSYGFETDLKTGSGAAGLGGTDNNSDVVANQPDDRYCAWNGINVDWKGQPSNQIARLIAAPPKKKLYSGDGYAPLFGIP